MRGHAVRPGRRARLHEPLARPPAAGDGAALMAGATATVPAGAGDDSCQRRCRRRHGIGGCGGGDDGIGVVERSVPSADRHRPGGGPRVDPSVATGRSKSIPTRPRPHPPAQWRRRATRADRRGRPVDRSRRTRRRAGAGERRSRPLRTAATTISSMRCVDDDHDRFADRRPLCHRRPGPRRRSRRRRR